MTSPRTPIQSPRFSSQNCSKSGVDVDGANSWMRPLESASVPKASLPCTRRSMSRPAIDDDPVGLDTGLELAEAVRERLGGVGDLVGVGLVEARSRATSGEICGSSFTVWFFSQIRRRPCRVSHGSSCSMESATGAISEARPPVATMVASPTTSSMRSHIPSTIAE